MTRDIPPAARKRIVRAVITVLRELRGYPEDFQATAAADLCHETREAVLQVIREVARSASPTRPQVTARGHPAKGG